MNTLACLKVMKSNFLLLALTLLIGCEIPTHQKYKSYPGGGNEIVMYSLTTCGYCTQKREQLKRERVSFTEHFIDKDSAKEDEMMKKLRAAGDNRNYITVPVFDVYGYMMVGNPSLEVIKSYIDKHTPKVDESSGMTEYRG